MLVVGLGNPGPGYARTRHNAGAMLVERLADELDASWGKPRKQMRTAEGLLEGRSMALGIPTTQMNVSGRPVGRLARKVGVAPSDLVICHDDLDLPLGRVRLKAGGGTGGHNGLESVAASLRSRDFLRLRLGIGRPPPGVDPVRHVLGKFAPDELELMDEAIERGIEGLRALVRDGLEAAQNFLHGK